MATIQFFGQSADMMGGPISLAQYYGEKTSTLFEVLGKYGTPLQVFYGNQFTYSGFARGGNIDRYDLFNSDGSLNSIWDIDITFQQYNSAASVGQSSEALHELILRGNDRLYGTDGNDRLRSSAGNDTIDGGDGSDTFSAADHNAAITIDLHTGRATSSLGQTRLVSIENAEGSAYADKLNGSNAANTLQGFGGADTIDGRGGIDTVVYRDATSAVTVNLATGKATGGSGNDDLLNIENAVGSRFGDKLIGDARANVLDGFLGNDSLDGGAGRDTADYHLAYNGVQVNLLTGRATGAHGNDTLINIEDVLGSAFGDVLTGDATTNQLNGGAGADTLTGGLGKDTLIGGTGADYFDFNATTESTATGRDIIDDFSRAQGDRIDLSGIDANINLAGNQAFAFIGADRFHKIAGEVRFQVSGANLLVQADVDGNGTADFAITVNNITSLMDADFVL